MHKCARKLEYANADEKISTDSKFWEAKHVKIKNGNGLNVNTPCLVRTKEKGTWAEALEDLLKNKGKLECTIFLSTVKLCALVDYMGADIFENM